MYNNEMACSWSKVAFGSTGLEIAPLGLSASYGASGKDVELAFARGINCFYWGSARAEDFGVGVRNVVRSHRDRAVIVIQSYARIASLLEWSLDRALRKLGIDHTDLLLLGWWNHLPPERILGAVQNLRDKGKVKHLMLSGHNRRAFPIMADNPGVDAIMVRYNAAHTGAEQEIFPHLPKRNLGVASYTATRWGALLDPKLTPAGERTPTAADCYRFVLSHPSVQLAMIGPANTAQLEHAMTALDKGPMLNEELNWMRKVGKAVRARKKLISRLTD
jgi:aryl-alcohol dehydrogenase-like predicted oxidoreductase